VPKLPDAVRKLFEGANFAHLATEVPTAKQRCY